jgi:hypothetical protein
MQMLNDGCICTSLPPKQALHAWTLPGWVRKSNIVFAVHKDILGSVCQATSENPRVAHTAVPKGKAMNACFTMAGIACGKPPLDMAACVCLITTPACTNATAFAASRSTSGKLPAITFSEVDGAQAARAQKSAGASNSPRAWLSFAQPHASMVANA